MSIYGYEGADAPFQLLVPGSPYPLTILEVVIVYTACAFCGVLLITALTLLLSSKFRSPFGVIIIIGVLIVVPTMLYVMESNVVLFNLYSLLPTNMMVRGTVFSQVPFDFFGLIVLPYVFLPIFGVTASALTLPFTRRAFRNHQIG
jgi:hypothetical protein